MTLNVANDFTFLNGKKIGINKPVAKSAYNQLLGSKLRTVSLWLAKVYRDTESLYRRNSYTRTLVASLNEDTTINGNLALHRSFKTT